MSAGNIASKALMAGGSAFLSFTFDLYFHGWLPECENQLNAVQTIQANTFSKGETTATINAQPRRTKRLRGQDYLLLH